MSYAGPMYLGYQTPHQHQCHRDRPKRTHMPDPEDDSRSELGRPAGIALDAGLHEREKLDGVILDLAIELRQSVPSYTVAPTHIELDARVIHEDVKNVGEDGNGLKWRCLGAHMSARNLSVAVQHEVRKRTYSSTPCHG